MLKCTEVGGNGRRSSRLRRKTPVRKGNKKKRNESLLSKLFKLVGKKEKQPKPTANAPQAEGEINSEIPPIPKPKRIWHGLDGKAVTVFGIAAPSVMIAFTAAAIPKRITLMLLNHPVETGIELALLALVPYANYLVWSSITNQRVKFPRAGAFALGLAIASSLITAAVCIAAMFVAREQFAEAIGTDFTLGFAWMAGFALLAGAASGYIAFRVRNNWDLDSTRRQIVMCTGAGVLMAALAFVGAETKSWITRTAERMSISVSPNEAKEGMAWLRRLNPERDMRMECSDARAAGLVGLFLPIKASSERELYFRLTGKPYSFREFANSDFASMSDEVLSANVVGDRVPGLSLARSTMIGSVHPNTLTSTFDWTFVFKNDTQQEKEMRAEVGLPPGAVVTGFTVWTKGDAQDARFIPGEEGTENSYYSGGNSPGMVTDLGHGRVLLSAYPIPQDEQAKVRVRMVVPLNPDSTKAASVVLPTFIATNFDLQGEQDIKIHSSLPLRNGPKELISRHTRDHEFVLEGRVSGDLLEGSGIVVEAERPQQVKPVFAFDKIATKDARAAQVLRERDRREQERADREAANDDPDHQVVVWIDGSRGLRGLEELKRAATRRSRRDPKRVVKVLENRYVIQRTQQVAAPAPTQLEVVIDGSATVGEHVKEVLAALQNIPAHVPTNIVVATSEPENKLLKPTPLGAAAASLPSVKFIGGQDNLKAVVAAAERAGENNGGAVLWVHGPQPALNHEIFIMAPYANAPKFYELPVGSGDTTDTVEFFRNHGDIGPFTQVSQSFFQKWRPNNTAIAAKLGLISSRPKDAVEATADEARELITLRAADATQALLNSKRTKTARSLAYRYEFVSPVSLAIITPGITGDEQAQEETEHVSELTEAQVLDQYVPKLQGATNGTVGPQGDDATVISGVNTAGTVRVNNLANLEALLNIFANIGEIGLVLGGGILVLHGFCRGTVLVEAMGTEIELGGGQRITMGALLVAAGLMLPGMLNWFVASARDANLFS